MLEVDGGVHRLPTQLFLAPAQELRSGRVHERQATLIVECVEPLHHGVHHGGTEALGFLALGYVGHDDPDSEHLSVDLNGVVARKPVLKVGLTLRLALDLHVHRRLAGFQHVTVHVPHLGPHLWDHFGDRPADVLMSRSSIDFGKLLVDANDPAIAIDEGKANRRGQLERFHERQRLGCMSLQVGESGHVLHGTDETARLALALVRHSREGAQDVQRPIGPDGAIGRSGQDPIPPGQFNLPLDAVAVVRVYTPDHVLGGGHYRTRLHAQKTKHVVRPQQNVGINVPLPRTGLRELLRSFERLWWGSSSESVTPVNHRVRASATASEVLGSLPGAVRGPH